MEFADDATAARVASRLAQDDASQGNPSGTPERLTLGGSDAWHVRLGSIEEVFLSRGPAVLEVWLDTGGRTAAEAATLPTLVRQYAETVVKRLP